jgi:hypothetical protein
LKSLNAQSLNWNLEQDQGSGSDCGKMVSGVPVPASQHAGERILKVFFIMDNQNTIVIQGRFWAKEL